ncbi:MAG: AHH domain-containing protein [Sphingomonadales bacterium]|nr:AHH domain-containing protein [Sphingomonadales bacterium]
MPSALTTAVAVRRKPRRPARVAQLHDGLIAKAAARRKELPFRTVNRPEHPGYDPQLQRHHLLPRELLRRKCFAPLFAALDGDWPGIEDFRSNGLLLPAEEDAALRSGLPLHRGPHRDYNSMVIERVGQLEAYWSLNRGRRPQGAQGDAIAGLTLLQRALRRRLIDPRSRKLALSRFDPGHDTADFTLVDSLVDALWLESDSPGLPG